MGRVIFDIARSGAMNMALDEAIFQNVKDRQIIIRFYSFIHPTLSLGIFQNYKKTVNERNCTKQGIDIVRRPTGGRAVLHHKEITYCVVVKDSRLKSISLRNRIYILIAKSWQEAIQKIGIKDVTFETQKKGRYFNKPSCFSISSFGEIKWNGRKMVGAAQKISGSKVLQHGFLLTNISPDYSNNSIIQPLDVSSDAVGVFDIVKYDKLKVERLKQYFVNSMARELSAKFVNSVFSDKERLNADLLFNMKYGDSAWTKNANLDNAHIMDKILSNKFAPVAQKDRARDS